MHKLVTSFLFGGWVITTLTMGYFRNEFKESEARNQLMLETVVATSSIVILQGIEIEELKAKMSKLNGIRTIY